MLDDYKQKALETAYCQSDPLNIYLLLADTDLLFIIVAASSKLLARSIYKEGNLGSLGVLLPIAEIKRGQSLT